MKTYSPVPFDVFREEVLKVYDPAKGATTSAATLAKFNQVLNGLKDLEGIKTTADLNADMIGLYVKSLSCNANSTRGLIGYLRTAVNLAAEEGWVDPLQMPASKWRRITPKAIGMTRNPVLTYAQVSTLLDHLRQRATNFHRRRLYALAYLIALTGLRRDEALCARIEDIDWERKLLHVVERERPLKTAASARSVALPSELVTVMCNWVPWCGGTWLFPGVRRRGPWLNASENLRALAQLQAAALEAGLGRVTWHGLRHSFATIALTEWKKPLWVVSRALGHTSIRTTERYLHPDYSRILADEFRDVGFRPQA